MNADVRPGSSVRPASGAAADAAHPRELFVQARARLPQLAAQAPLRSIAPMCSTRWSPISKAQTPDHIAVTGDLVNLSLPSEFAPGAGLARRPRRPARRHASCPAITMPMCDRRPALPRATGATSCAATAARRLSLRAAARAAGADRPVDVAADARRWSRPAHLHGDQIAASRRAAGATQARAGVPRRADPSSAGRRRASFPPADECRRARAMCCASTAPSSCCTATITRRSLHWLPGPQLARAGGRRAVGLGRAGSP